MSIKPLNPPDLPMPIAPYSMGARAGDAVYVSGVLALDGDGKTIGAGDPRALRLTHLAMTRWRDGEAVKSNAMRSFRAMAKAVRIISRLQPETDALNELQPPPGQERSESGPDIANYTGCNVRKTRHSKSPCRNGGRGGCAGRSSPEPAQPTG
jgi:hypothetical protein